MSGQEPITIRTTEQIKKDFQVWCVVNDKSMQEVLEEYIIGLVKPQAKSRRRG
jgi:hypothetical protein